MLWKADNPNSFVKDDDTIINKTKESANEFNDYFVNVGYSLTNSVVEPRIKDGVDEDILHKNSYSIFIRGVDEKEILDIVKHFKNKKSTDCNEIDIISKKQQQTNRKNITACIVKPLTHTCNQFFQTGKFPSKTKTAKVIPIYKSGN